MDRGYGYKFLMDYGWAILCAFIVVGVLFYVIGFSNPNIVDSSNLNDSVYLNTCLKFKAKDINLSDYCVQLNSSSLEEKGVSLKENHLIFMDMDSFNRVNGVYYMNISIDLNNGGTVNG